MKDRILIVSSILLFIIAMAIAEISHFVDSEKALIIVFLSVLTCGFNISFMVFALSGENSKGAFFESLKYSFGLSSLILILGYIVFCLQPILFN